MAKWISRPTSNREIAGSILRPLSYGPNTLPNCATKHFEPNRFRSQLDLHRVIVYWDVNPSDRDTVSLYDRKFQPTGIYCFGRKSIHRLHSEIVSRLVFQQEVTGAEPVAT